MLLEWDSNLANSCSVIEKKTKFLKCTFAIFHFFSVTFLPVARKKIYIDTNNNSDIPIDCR